VNARIRASVRRMSGYTPGEQPRDPGVVKLNTNENPYPPSPLVAQALRAADPEALRLYPDPLAIRLRERIAALHGATVAQVFAGNGSDEVLALCSSAFVERDGSIGHFDPSYSLYPVLAEMRDVADRPVPLGPDFEWRMPAGYEASLFLLASPNAPTGRRPPRAEVEAFCDRFPGVVVIDEAYADFARDRFMDLALSRPNVLVSRTLSKSYSLAGLRLGYAVGPEDLIAALYKIKDSYNLDRLTQELALAALSDPGHMRANVERIVRTRERTAAELARRGFRVAPSDANFLWARPPEGRDARTVFDALRARRVLVRHFPGPRTGDHLRITVGTDEQMDEFLRVADDILKG
jgi:histidinol-phosphate aminotransferase